MLVDEGQEPVDLFRDGKVEEDVDAGEAEVVEEAEEVDAEGGR